MKMIILISAFCFAGCVSPEMDKQIEGNAWEFQPDEVEELSPIEELDVMEPDQDQDDDLVTREFDIDGCWNADLLPADQSMPIDFSGFRKNACLMSASNTGYYKVSIPAGFRLQLNEPNTSRPTLSYSCEEISPAFCKTPWESERLTQNNSDQAREMVLEYFEDSPLDPTARVRLYPLANNISCDSPRDLKRGERLNGNMREGGAWDFNPCRLENNENATQFYQVDVPLGEDYFVEIAANDPNNRSISAQVVNVHHDDFSCDNAVEGSCILVPDLAAGDDGLVVLRLDASWGAGRDPARAIIAVSGSTTLSDSGYSILLTNDLSAF